jgi:hypothetical protein
MKILAKKIKNRKMKKNVHFGKQKDENKKKLTHDLCAVKNRKKAAKCFEKKKLYTQHKMVMIGQQHACLMLGDEERGEKGLSL